MTLRTLREDAGLTTAQVAAHVASYTGESCAPGTPHLWEHRGITKIGIIEALADLYNLPVASVSKAALASAQGLGPKQKRGRKPKILLQNVVNS